MLRKDITYTDINDIDRTEPFYFHFTELELGEVELEMGGIEETMERLTETQDIKTAYKIFKDLVLAGYGKKSADGKGFDKVDPDTGRPYSRELVASPALSALIIDLMNDVEDAGTFFRGMLPSKMQKQAAEADAALKANPQLAPGATPESVQTEALVVTTAEGIREKTWEEYTKEELLEMPHQQFQALLPSKMHDAPRDLLLIAMERKTQ